MSDESMSASPVLYQSPAICHGIWALVNAGKITVLEDRLIWERDRGLWTLVPGPRALTIEKGDVASFSLEESAAWGDRVALVLRSGEKYTFLAGTAAYLRIKDTLALFPVNLFLDGGNKSRDLFLCIGRWIASGDGGLDPKS